MKIFSNSLVKVTFFLSQLYFLVWTHISSFKKLHLWGIAFFWLKSYRKIIAVHSFVVFRHTSARISHRYIHIPSFPDLPPISLPTPPFSLSQSPCIYKVLFTYREMLEFWSYSLKSLDKSIYLWYTLPRTFLVIECFLYSEKFILSFFSVYPHHLFQVESVLLLP